MKTLLLDLMREMERLRIATVLAGSMAPTTDVRSDLRRFSNTVAADNVTLLEALEHEQSDSLSDVVARVARLSAGFYETRAGKYARLMPWWNSNGDEPLNRVLEYANRVIHILGVEAA
jgi:hypothetical protein